MRAIRRILVGVNGPAPSDSVIRYAVMIARIHANGSDTQWQKLPRGKAAHRARSSTRAAAAPPCPVHSGAGCAIEGPELRVAMRLPPDESDPSTRRAALAARFNQHLSALPQHGPVQIDVLTDGRLARLKEIAANFDSDLLVTDQPADLGRERAQLATETVCPVWLVPPDTAPVLRRILVPIDFSYRAVAAIQAAVDLSRQFHAAKCIALHVTQQNGYLCDGSIAEPRRRELTAEFRRYISDVDSRGVHIEPMFLTAPCIARAVARVATEVAADVAVLICRPRSRLSNIIYPGLIASIIRECKTPVLVLKSAENPLSLVEAMKNRWRSAEVPQYS